MNNNNLKVIRVGSRKSELALIQTKHVIACLQKKYPEQKFEIHTMTTVGDRVLHISLPKIGEKSLFTKDLEEALSNGSVDFVVHSLKDLPTCLPAGMAIGAILEREDPRDALVLNAKFFGKSLDTLPRGSVIGTSSLRRAAQLARCYPHLIVEDIRGNLNTRLAKLDIEDSKFAGIILAQAGLERMGWHNRISQTIEPADILYAVGQGALAVECRSNDQKILNMLRKLTCLQTQCKILTERSFLKTLGGGCSAPVAVNTILKRQRSELGFELNITGAVWSLDGKIEVQGNTKCTLDLEDDINEIIPSKKIKISNTSSKPKEINNDGQPKKSKSPPIVDDSIATSSVQGSKLDLNAFINIHGDLFKKCPYNLINKINTENTNLTAKHECPLNIAVGLDVMGKCPYYETDQKILVSDCKNENSLTNETAHQNIDAVDKTNVNEQVVSIRKEATESDIQKCPFLQQTEGKNENTNTLKDDKLLSNEETLYCGLYRHKSVPFNIFEKCEALGRTLATNLIENGALKVMESAQLEIRRNI